MQIQAKIRGILYDCGGKPGSNYPDLEPGKEFWNRVRVPGSTTNNYCWKPAAYVFNARRYANCGTFFSS